MRMRRYRRKILLSGINLGVNDLDEIVYVHIYHDDPEEDLEEFSADLEEAFGKAIAFQSLFE